MTERYLGVEVLTSDGAVGKLLVPPHAATQPVAIGTRGDVGVDGPGIAPQHVWLFLQDGQVLARANANAILPATLDHRPIPDTWVELGVPGRIQIGETTLRFFWCHARASARSERTERNATMTRTDSATTSVRRDLYVDEEPTIRAPRKPRAGT